MLERRRAAWQSCKTFPYTIHFKTFVFLPKTTQTPPSSRETQRAHHHPDATQRAPSAPPSAVDQLQDIPVHLKPLARAWPPHWSCKMQDQPTTWRDILGAVIIGASLGLLLAAFI